MPRECRGCDWHEVLWCSIRARLVGSGVVLPCVPVDTELAQAKAEIERLRHEVEQIHDRLTHIQARLTTRRDYWEKRCLKAEQGLARLEIASADAEIGRLVRGMRRGSTLIHTGPFVVETDWVGQHLPDIYQWADDPADALRAIQEVGDAQEE